ncbi:FAD-dependent oxidoreductase [Candidatus Nitrospira neomarina]|uniref:FAD-dependent oxidoreductase n=1 Tax=Candidatus Nitrospira neomarina TaxID=3020899 RepID=A0AA96JXI6_9BACT|nr:FAD-dependent oxidoreductase [Candidatus Nitrospira neomarina]WNM63942.1 FAD-dependent oxidoreductase [Candidatus Nitrospira neomarina]
MTHHILILSGNLPGLLAAYRLIPYGFRITILEDDNPVSSAPSSPHFAKSIEPDHPPSLQRLTTQPFPLILPRYYHATWELFQELALEHAAQCIQPVNLEFGTSECQTLTLSNAKGIATLHPMIRLAGFRALPWSDRWHLINFLEKKWEEPRSPDHHPDMLTVESWLISAQQSALARQRIWNPFCRLFLGCDVTQASLGYFLEILSRFWLSKPNGPETFLASPDMQSHLQQKLRHVLIEKGVTFYPSHAITGIHADTERIQAIGLAKGERLNADIYVSPLSPPELLRLLPERAPARFSCFSHLAQLQESLGTVVQLTLNDTLLPPRLILNSSLFDWVTSQAVPFTDRPTTLVTGINLSSSPLSVRSGDWLKETAWPHLKKILNICPEQSMPACAPPITQSAYRYIPCMTGFRTFRPLANTPIPNLFLTGPWTASPLPPSLESTILSAFGCARAVTEWVQTSSH